MLYVLGDIKRVQLGRQGENLARTAEIDVIEWLTKWPDARIELVARRPHESEVYLVTTRLENNVLIWPVTSADTGVAGIGRAELRAIIGETVVKSAIFDTVIQPCLDGIVVAPPPATPDWVADVLGEAERAEKAAERAEKAAERAEKASEQTGQAGPATGVEQDGLLLADKQTGKTYRLYVQGSKLTMEEAEA